MFDAVQTWVEEAVESVGVLGLALAMMLENVFPPIPSEVVLPLAGYFVATGRLTFIEALLGATAGAVAGALALYAIGRYGGLPLIFRYRRVLRVSETEIERADRWFDHYGTWLVFFGRMIPIIRSIVSIPAGMSEMPMIRFLALTAAGASIWNALLIGAGWTLGSRYEEVAGIVGPASRIIGVLLLIGLVYVTFKWWKRRQVA